MNKVNDNGQRNPPNHPHRTAMSTDNHKPPTHKEEDANEANNSRAAMKLRKFRKASVMEQDAAEQPHELDQARIVKPVKKRLLEEAKIRCAKEDEGDTDYEYEFGDTELEEDEEEDREAKAADELSKVCEENINKSEQPRQRFYRISESGTMTLEQFTDIVLASEGMFPSKDSCTNNSSVDTATSSPIKELLSKTCSIDARGQQRSVNSDDSLEDMKQHKAMVENILQNKNLTVEVKPIRTSKPVVLSPRHPEEFYNSSRKAQSVNVGPDSASMMVSVKPRVNRLVEEWFRKMEDPASPPRLLSTCTQDTHEVLNLSVKDANQAKRTDPGVSNRKIYLKPISSMQDPEERLHHSHLKFSKFLNHHHHHRHYRNEKPYSVPTRTSAVVLPPLSPPRLQITRVESNGSTTKDLSMNKVGLALPFETNELHRSSIKSRALRDIQLAHTKDMHGNYPIHMGVLMRKTGLVRRYCCVLQILDSPVDLINEDRLTPLHLAVRDNSLEIIELLLAFGANPAIKDQGGNTSFHMAAATRAKDSLRLLVESVRSKHDLNSPNEFGITPLQITMMNGDKVGSELLIKYGADSSLLVIKRELRIPGSQTNGHLPASLATWQR